MLTVPILFAITGSALGCFADVSVGSSRPRFVGSNEPLFVGKPGANR